MSKLSPLDLIFSNLPVPESWREAFIGCPQEQQGGPPRSGFSAGFSLLLARPPGEGHLQESYLLGISTLKPLAPLNKQHPETELAHGWNSLPLWDNAQLQMTSRIECEAMGKKQKVPNFEKTSGSHSIRKAMGRKVNNPRHWVGSRWARKPPGGAREMAQELRSWTALCGGPEFSS